jgi:leucyl-tRNA synthetase
MKYVCVMFPYPSAASLHVGHYYNYALVDSYCRWLRSNGEEVFQPFGYDAFGLPAEQYAIKMNRDPREFTEENIGKFREQMGQMNTQYEEVLTTTDAEYISRTQWVFNIMLERGLAYKAKAEVDWCHKCDTTLAREQVAGGSCDRCGSKPEKKVLDQWYFKITEYRDRLVSGLDSLDWPEHTKKAQRNWLANQHDWCVSRQRSWGCPIPVPGETDTLDTFVDSSFYFIEYCLRKGMDPKPVDLYVGGAEHACMHLIYARFVCMVLHDAGHIGFEEPFTKLVHQGMILNNGEKMSKSKGNAVTLDEYNPDTVRFYLMFIGHYFDGGSWSDDAIVGVERFKHRFAEWVSRDKGVDEIDLDSFFERIDGYTKAFKFNKVVSEFMTLYKNNKSKNLTIAQRTLLVEKIRIYMPGFE